VRQSDGRRREGAILILVLILAMAFGFLVTFFLNQNQVQARATRFRLGAIRALYDGYSELEKAQAAIGASSYDAGGHNQAIAAALARADRKIDGTEVKVARLTGTDGTWYSLTVAVPFEDSERIVTETVREIDFFSSYNLFVSEDPAGISGSPIGAIHSNKGIQFYFPDGLYRHSVTAVDGVSYKAGATPDNTTVSGPFNPNAGRIEIDYDGSDRFNLNYIQSSAEAAFNFDGSKDLKLRLYPQGGVQWVHIEEWSKPEVKTITETVITGYQNVNPHEETYSWTERVQTGTETRTRDVQVLDHTDTVQEPVNVPVYVSDVRMVSVPVYRTEERTRMVTRRVWVPMTSGTGGTAVGGDNGQLGYWMDEQVPEAYSVQVFDHNDQAPENYQRLDHYDTVLQTRQVPVYRTETQTYQVDVYQDQNRTGTRTVYDHQPIYETQTRTQYNPAQMLSSAERQAPDNGLLFTAGDVKSLSGEIVERMTVACRGSVKISGDLVYMDSSGNTAYLNGKTPWLPYEPNPAYANRATLGVIALNDVIISRSVPDNLEINASLLAMTGRVGIDGIVLDSDGEVAAFNQFKDQYGRPVAGDFKKNSIRRLGGITTARRPVETVVKDGSIRSGFNVGQAVFDIGLMEGPPPFFLPFPIPRFFATIIEK
jgi:hypothetical protein